MTPRPTLLAIATLAAHSGAALAQYKCTSATGAVTYQQTACAGAKTEQKLDIVPNGHPPPASGAAPAPPVIVRTAASASVGKVETNVDKRMLANYERQRQREALEAGVKSAQDQKARRAQQRLESIAATRKQYGDDPTNAAALRDALASVDSRYRAFNELDDLQIQSAQAKLDAWDKAQRPAPPPAPAPAPPASAP